MGLRRDDAPSSAPAKLCRKTGYHRGLRIVAGLSLALSASPALAQSTVNPSADWNGNYGFGTTADGTLRLLQSDLIRKAEEGYYEGLGRQTFNVTNNNTTYDHSVTEIGQQTTTIGSVNNSTNNIDISRSNNIALDLQNKAITTGCLNGSISIDSRPASAGTLDCN